MENKPLSPKLDILIFLVCVLIVAISWSGMKQDMARFNAESYLQTQEGLDLVGSLPQPLDWVVYEKDGRWCILATNPPLVGCGDSLKNAVTAAKIALMGDGGKMRVVWQAK